MNYRNNAEKSLKRAQGELDSDSPTRVRYGALELRMALEGLIYDRASLYKEELSGKELNTWQPKQLLELLLELDPAADKNCSVSAGIEETPGKPSKDIRFLGTDRVLTLKEIKKYIRNKGI